MSGLIDRLISKYCPEGVEYRKLGSDSGVSISTGKCVTKVDIVPDGRYEIVSGGKEILGMIDRYNREAYSVTIARAGGAGLVIWHEKPFYLNDKCFSIIPKGNGVVAKYLYYALKNIESDIISMKSRGTVPTINKKQIENLTIPVPPLPVQKEIVRILDKFSELENELESELESELELRKKQFEYYRNKMLTKDYLEQCCPEGVEYRKLDSGTDERLVKIETGQLDANAAVENGKYMFFTTARQASRTDSYDWDCEALIVAGNANIGDMKHYKGKFNAYQRTYILTNFHRDISPRFLYFVMLNNLKQYLNANKNVGAMTYIVLSTLQNFTIPVPPLPVQKEIVRILDKFSTLTNSICEGLPAEIKLGHRRYEYYRDELFKFEKLESETA